MAKKCDVDIQAIVDQLNIAMGNFATEADFHELWFHLQHAQRLLNKEMKNVSTMLADVNKVNASKKGTAA